MITIVDPVRFVTGTVGAPGSREFFIQAVGVPEMGGSVATHSVGLEKVQAARLAEKIQELVDRLDEAGMIDADAPGHADLAPLDTPVDAQFAVGAMSIAFEEDTGRFVVEFFPIGYDPDLDDGDGEPELGLSVAVTHQGARDFARRTLSVVMAGRPPCPFCTEPLDPSGHVCVRANGYRR